MAQAPTSFVPLGLRLKVPPAGLIYDKWEYDTTGIRY